MPRYATKTFLTVKAIDAMPAAPKGKRIEVYDSQVPGFAVRVTDMGSKSFFLLAGKPTKRHLLGTVGKIDLAAARDKAREFLAEIERGNDPAAARAHVLAERKALLAPAVIDQFIAAKLGNTAKLQQMARVLREEFGAQWIGRDIRSITTRDISEIVLAISTDRPAQAHCALAYVRRFTKWAFGTGLIDRDPGAVAGNVVNKPEARDRVLTNTELAQVWNVVGSLPYPIGPIVRMLILTGCRKSEVAEARWCEFDMAAKVWTIPAKRMKGGIEHSIPLTPALLSLLAELPKHNGGDFLFSLDGGVSPATFRSKAKARIDALLPGVTAWVIHDLRRTMRTALPDAGVWAEVAEVMIAHKQPGIAGVYNRNSYAAHLRDGFIAWHNHLDRIVNSEVHHLAA